MIAELRAELELARRRRLHRQIGALRTQLNVMAARNYPGERVKAMKLLAKIKRLDRELAQPFLLPPQPRA